MRLHLISVVINRRAQLFAVIWAFYAVKTHARVTSNVLEQRVTTSPKDSYRSLCDREPAIHLFARDFWLDAVCGEAHWDVAIVERGGQVVGAMPYYRRRHRGMTYLVQPPLTQKLGPWIRPTKAKNAKRLGREKDIMQELIEQLPEFSLFSQNWHHTNLNWLPFYWAGFDQTTNYTYILDDLGNEQQLWHGLADRVRTDIRKATERFSLTVRDDLGLEALLALGQMTFERQGRRAPYSVDLVRRIDQACASRSCASVLIAVDEHDRHHAGAYIVWDERHAYYLLGGGNPELRNSGATSLVIWEAIRRCAKVTSAFDFEGSMVESIERFFRGFGARQVPYFGVRKDQGLLPRLARCYRTLRGQQ